MERKSKFLGGYPKTPNDRQQEVGDKVCDGCGNFDPWSPDSAPAFYSITSMGQKMFVHQLPRHLRKYCAQHGCIRCGIIGAALAIYRNPENEKDDDMVKMRISATPGARGIIVGHHKRDRIELFIPPGNTYFLLPELSILTLLVTTRLENQA
jgi:hypothetical protein